VESVILACPAPLVATDRVQLGHGSGGKMSAALLGQRFLPALTNDALAQLGDGSMVRLAGVDVVVSTDTFVVSPLEFPGGDIGSLAVHGTLNDVAMMGASPVCLTVGFVLNATQRGIKVHDLEIAMEGYFDNILKWAGHAPDGNPGYRGITAKLFVKADADEGTLREIWKLAVEGSPVTQSVVRGTPVKTEFEAV